jgi:hypothetical protein
MQNIFDSRYGYVFITLILYMASWAMASGISTAALVVVRRRPEEDLTPHWLNGLGGTRLAYCASAVCISSSVSQLIWGIVYLKWYILVIAGFFGLGGSGPLLTYSSTANLIRLGPPLLVLINAILWSL